MFVFPAFDSNYKSRKRTFKCCTVCRQKRIKCDITAANFELVGCQYCRIHNLRCNLITKKRQLGPEPVEEPLEPLGTETTTSDPITPQYLKEKFNFNISGQESSSNYQYVFHDHPKAIISNTVADKSVYHESGVYVSIGDDTESGQYKPYKIKDFGGTERKYHLKSSKVYNFLVSINAFTVSSPEFHFTLGEIRQLIDLYFFKLNSILPIVHSKRFWDDFHENKVPSVIVYAMILAMLRDGMAEPILKKVFARNKSKLSYHEQFVEFVTQLEMKIRQVLLVLPELGDIDKLLKLVVQLLLWFHYKFDRLGIEQSSHDLTAAISLAGSLGIQMKDSSGKFSKEKSEYSTNLWWCCYVLDRFNAVVNCRFLFISNEDFNVDLPYTHPHLLKMVQLAESFEKMLLAIFQPFRNGHEKTRERMFDPDEFQRIEFKLCEEELNRARHGKLYNFPNTTTAENQEQYIDNQIRFLSRMVNNTVILASQKAKYDDSSIPNYMPESVALKAAENTLFHFKSIEWEQVLNIPLVCWCNTISMSCWLKKKAREALRTEISLPHPVIYTYTYKFEDYLEALEKLSFHWWVVEEICNLTKDFATKLDTTKTRQSAISSKTDLQAYALENEPRPKRMKLPVHTNVSSSGTSDSGDLPRTPMANLTAPSPGVEVISGTINENYDSYLESMHIDMFDTEFFKDLPQVMNFLH